VAPAERLDEEYTDRDPYDQTSAAAGEERQPRESKGDCEEGRDCDLVTRTNYPPTEHGSWTRYDRMICACAALSMLERPEERS
jgi:hypothetical protein